MAHEVKVQDAKMLLAPLPETARGYGIHVDVSSHGNLLAYTNSNNVIIRSLENPSEARVFSKHLVKANVARFSPNGEYVASGDDSGKVIIWVLKTQAIKREVPIGKRVLDIAWSDDGQKIAAVGDGTECKARVFSADTGNNVGEITGHNKTILSVSYSPCRPYHIVTVAEDFMVNFHAGPPFKFQHSFQELTNFVNCVRYSPSGDKFVVVSADRQIVFFDGKTGEKVNSVEHKDGHQGSIYSVCWSPDGKQVLSVSGDKTAKLWNVEDLSLQTTFTFGNEVNDMQVACAWLGEYIITVSLSGAINYLDLANPDKPKRVVVGHQAPLGAIAVDPSIHSIFSGDNTGVVCRWDMKTGDATWFSGVGHGKAITSLAVDASHSHLLSTGLDDRLVVSDINALAFGDTAFALDGLPTAVASSSTAAGLYAVSIAQKKLVVISDHKVVANVELKYRPNSVAISPENKEIAVAGDDKKVHLYTLDGNSVNERKTLTQCTNQVNFVSYSANGKYVTACDKDRSTFFWDRQSEEKCLNSFGWKYHSAAVNGCEWSPDGTKLATCSIDRSWIVFYDATNVTGNKNKKFPLTHGGGISAIHWLDNESLVTYGDDRVIKLWDVPATL